MCVINTSKSTLSNLLSNFYIFNERKIVDDNVRCNISQVNRYSITVHCPFGREKIKHIVKYKQTKCLDKSIGMVDREMVLLRAYRTRLIADVVTGKLEVREAAAKLPEEPEEPELVEEISEQVEGEEETEETDLDMVSEEASIAD